MNDTPGHNHYLSLSKLKFFFALSRTQHGLIDMAAPGLCALVWLGAFPDARTILLGLITTFAGYTAVYALNDVVDYRVDKERLLQSRSQGSGNYLDDLLARHPMAGGFIALKDGVIWFVAWSIVAMAGAYLLNPMCVLIFSAGCALEIIYCRLLKITHLRTVVSGVVKTTGAMAAIFAVDPNPSLARLGTLFLWLFFWEIGGQNIPADWTDLEEDRRFNAKTIPVRYGPDRASKLILASIMLTILMNIVLFGIVIPEVKSLAVAASGLAGVYLLVIPAVRLYKTKRREQAIHLFNKASFYPLALLVIIIANIVF